VTVNGEVCLSSALKFDLTAKPAPAILVDGVALRPSSKFRASRLWAVNKKAGELVDTSDDAKGRALVIDRLKPLLLSDKSLDMAAIKPVYRLEYNTEGLCLLTDSGRLAKFLDGNTLNLARHFRVRVNGVLSESKLQGLRRGVTVDGVKMRPMDVTVQHTSGTMSWVGVTCYENKNRVIQKAFKKMFLNITRLICVGFGPYRLNECAAEPGMVAEIKLTPELNGSYLKSTTGAK
jgi:23S rRNA pseudouridine2605 synthase